MTDKCSMTSNLLFRRVVGTKLPNEYIYFEKYFLRNYKFLQKNLNFMAQLTPMANQQILHLVSQFRRPQKTVVPSSEQRNFSDNPNTNLYSVINRFLHDC